MQYRWDTELDHLLQEIEHEIIELRREKLTKGVILSLRDYFRIQHIIS